MELRSATGHFTTTGTTEIFQRTRDGFNWATDFQVAPKKTGLQRSIISVGPVCDRGSIIVFWSIGGAIVNKGSGHWMEFRACWRRLHAESPHSSAKKTLGTRGTKMLMGFKQDSAGDDEALRAKPANGPVLPCESQPDEAAAVNTVCA